MSKELLENHTYIKDNSRYCKHCDSKMRIEERSFSYNHGYHTIYTTKYYCDCETLKSISPIVIRIKD